MGARAIWKGNLMLDAQPIPVKLYSAVQDRDIHFHILDASRQERIRQRMVKRDTSEEVPKEEIQKAYQVEPGTYVVLEKKELDALEPEASREIELMEFVPDAAIDHLWYERPYWLGPDDGAEAAYFALADALKHENREGVARWVMRKKRYVGSLRPRDGYLMLITLRWAEEVLSAADLPTPGGRPPDPKELKMAEQLVSMLEGEFHIERFHDEYRERVKKFIEAKAKGQKPKLPEVKRKAESKSLLQSLAASVNAARRERGKAIA